MTLLESGITSAIDFEKSMADQALKSARIAQTQCSIPRVEQAVDAAAAHMAKVGGLAKGAQTAKALARFQKWLVDAGPQMDRANAMIKEARARLFPARVSGGEADGASSETENARRGHPAAARQMLNNAREVLHSLFGIGAHSEHQPPQAGQMSALAVEIDQLARIEEEAGEAALTATRECLEQGRLEDARREHQRGKLSFLRAGVEQCSGDLSSLLAQVAEQESAAKKGSEKLPQVEAFIHARRLVPAQELLEEAVGIMMIAHIDEPTSDNHHLSIEVERLQAVIARVKTKAVNEYRDAVSGIQINLDSEKLADADKNLKVKRTSPPCCPLVIENAVVLMLQLM